MAHTAKSNEAYAIGSTRKAFQAFQPAMRWSHDEFKGSM